jgi:hypothetical protein
LAPAPAAIAGDCCGQRQWQSLQAANQRIEMRVDQFAQIGHRARREIEIREILSRAETAARTGQHECTGAGRFDLVECGAQFLVHRARKAVELVRPVQRDGRYATRCIDVEANRFI